MLPVQLLLPLLEGKAQRGPREELKEAAGQRLLQLPRSQLERMARKVRVEESMCVWTVRIVHYWQYSAFYCDIINAHSTPDVLTEFRHEADSPS